MLVEVHATGVSALDARIRDGVFKLFLPLQGPIHSRQDVAGVVRTGPFAERIPVHEDDLAINAASLSMAEAASAPSSH